MSKTKYELTDFIRNQRSEENYINLPLKGRSGHRYVYHCSRPFRRHAAG